MLQHQARKAYESGLEHHAARLYECAAEQAKDAGDVTSEFEARRWVGNSLMWSGQHPEALRILLPVAGCDHPLADAKSVYGAKTDCIMLSLPYATAGRIKAMLEQTAAYLARIGKQHWEHRLDLLNSMLLCRQGKFQEAAVAGARAHRLVQRCMDGPKYTDKSYVRWALRPLFFLQQEPSLNEWLRLAETLSDEMLSDRLNTSCMRLLSMRLARKSGRPAPGLRDEARATARLVQQTQNRSVETFEVGRALMLAGDWEALASLRLEGSGASVYENALFVMDREVNRLRHSLGLPPWDPDLNRPEASSGPVHDPGGWPKSAPPALTMAWEHLMIEAEKEDQRLETDFSTACARLREEHAAKILTWRTR